MGKSVNPDDRREVLLALNDVGVSYGGFSVLDGVTLHIHPSERVCLLGRNGEGKTTLLKLLSGDLEPDLGIVSRRQGLRVTRLRQEVPTDIQGRVFDLVAEGLGEVGAHLRQYQALSRQLESAPHDEKLLGQLERIQHEIEMEDGWEIRRRVTQTLTRLSLEGDAQFEALSGGLKRRVLLARALVCEPDVLLLDEPTNHLDIDAITWMEDFLAASDSTLVFVTHDRMFLRRLATRIVEIDRGQITSWPGDFETYLSGKTDALRVEADQRQQFDKKLALEETWLRQGIKARRTRNEGRVRALERLRDERRKRRERLGDIELRVQEARRSGKLVIEAKNITHAFGDNIVLRDFSCVVARGDRIGVIGPNGSGKTTLLRILLGQLAPQKGDVRLGVNLEVIYFDQMRDQIDETKTVFENVGEGNDRLVINGQTKHIIGYLKDFLFTPDRARSPVSVLSGGERNRLMLAKLFTKPSNVLVMDEPTNDLDVETLERIEEMILEYPGTVLLVSHDRAFLNSVVTSTLVLGEDGRVGDFVGGYDDWLRQRPTPETEPAPKKQKPAAVRRRPRNKPPKLTFKQNAELEALPQRIEELESEQATLYTKMADPGFYRDDPTAVSASQQRLEAIETELEVAYERWTELESIREASTTG